MSEPYSEEDIEDQVMHNWLDHFEMRFHRLHASGHMNRQQITGLVNYKAEENFSDTHGKSAIVQEDKQKRSDDKIWKRIHIMICVHGICWMTISRDSIWMVLSDLIVTFVGALYFRVGRFFSVLRVRFLWGTFPVEYSRGRLCLSNVC